MKIQFFDKQQKSILQKRKIKQTQKIMSINVNQQFQYTSSEQQILLPMCNIMPANDIISKHYDPDETPIIKLITKNDQKQKQLGNNTYNFKHSKYSNPQFTDYAKLYSTNDFLGRYYADRLDQMIYFKFNNKEYNQLKVGDKKYRFFSGFFIQKEHFQDIAHQKYENVMKSFPFMDFVDYNTNLLDSFGDNTKGSPQDPKFSSNYDSANLFAVIKKQPFEYDLILQNDMNSRGNTQWFNFLVNFSEEGTYKFNIVNFTKSHSLYEQGMKIACYSLTKQSYRKKHENQKNGAGWFRGGKEIKYYRNGIQRESLGSNESYYTLSFEYTIKNRGESIMFAYSYPYTSLDTEKYFNKIIHRRVMGHFKMEKFQVGITVANHPIFGYMISHRKLKSSSSMKFKESLTASTDYVDKLQNSKGFNFAKIFGNKFSFQDVAQQANQLKSVILMSRQHPGQTQSSFVLQGIVDYLMANTQLDQIKKNFIFFIFPMVNVDGVKYGHYRTNLCGFDVNRVWRVPRKDSHPQVYHIKKLLYEINRNTPISLIIDIHGHSKSLNSFFYGNPSKKENLSFEDPKTFPFICSKRIEQISYKQSTFNVRHQKKNSARVVLSEMFPKALVYTLENSFYGYVSKKPNQSEKNEEQQKEIHEFTPEGYRRVGRQLMSTYLEYTRLCEKNTTIKAKWIKQMSDIYAELEKSRCADLSDDGGSDSEFQNELIEFQQQPKPRIEQEQKVPSPTKLEKPFNLFNRKPFLLRRNEKKKTMPLPKTICDQNVRGISSHNMRTFNNLSEINDRPKFLIDQKQNCIKNSSQICRGPQKNQAVLSIFKIETQKSSLLKKKTSINTLLESQQNGLQKQRIPILQLSQPLNAYSKKNCSKPELENNKMMVHRKKSKEENEKKMNLDDVITKCTGMKTFLKAMGITIQNRKG